MARLIDRILAQDSITTVCPITQERKPWPTAGIRAAIRIEADEVGHLFWANEKDYWDQRDDCGPIRAPYPLMWIEWMVPLRCHAEGEWRTRPRAEQMVNGCLVESREMDDGSSVLRILSMFALGNRGEPFGWMLETYVMVDPDGRYREHKLLVSDEIDKSRRMDAFDMDFLVPCLLTLGLMNCSNVTLESVPTAINSRKHRKQGQPDRLLSYTKVRLPGAASGSTGSGFGPDRALHLVRGHFKTFTEEAPLFGKVTGTYWWGWQGRGDPARGVRIPDYEVATR